MLPIFLETGGFARSGHRGGGKKEEDAYKHRLHESSSSNDRSIATTICRIFMLETGKCGSGEDQYRFFVGEAEAHEFSQRYQSRLPRADAGKVSERTRSEE